MSENQHKLTIEPIGNHYRIVKIDNETKTPLFEEYDKDIPLEIMERLVEVMQEQYDIGYKEGHQEGYDKGWERGVEDGAKGMYDEY